MRGVTKALLSLYKYTSFLHEDLLLGVKKTYAFLKCSESKICDYCGQHENNGQHWQHFIFLLAGMVQQPCRHDQAETNGRNRLEDRHYADKPWYNNSHAAQQLQHAEHPDGHY